MTDRYESAIDLDSIVAIDVHTHIEADDHGHLSLDDELMDASAAYFKAGPAPDPHARPGRCSTTANGTWLRSSSRSTPRTETGHPALSSEEIAAGALRNNDVLIPFGSVDPRRGDEAVERARRLVVDHGVRGMKLHPSLQGFEPNDARYYPLYDALAGARRHRALPHRADRHRSRTTGRSRHQAPLLRPHADRRRRGRLPPTARSSWPTPPSRGPTPPSRSPPTRPTCTSTCRAGCRSTSRRSSSGQLGRSSSARHSSAPTSRSSPRSLARLVPRSRARGTTSRT